MSDEFAFPQGLEDPTGSFRDLVTAMQQAIMQDQIPKMRASLSLLLAEHGAKLDALARRVAADSPQSIARLSVLGMILYSHVLSVLWPRTGCKLAAMVAYDNMREAASSAWIRVALRLRNKDLQPLQIKCFGDIARYSRVVAENEWNRLASKLSKKPQCLDQVRESAIVGHVVRIEPKRHRRSRKWSER